MAPGRRAAIYLRVSSEEQTYENQRPEVERVVSTRGYELVARYEEHASAAKHRDQFERMMSDAHRGMFDVLVVWALDRFGRSMVGNIQAVLELDRRGVQVVSVREPWLDTGGPAVRPLLIAIFGWVAEQERVRLSERTRAGMERARRSGVRIGRPSARVDVERALALRREGKTLPEIADLPPIRWTV
jgi:DNA invertase Pin-like site-specific DNA recombinase